MDAPCQKVPARREESDAIPLVQLISEQHGVVARRQLLVRGISSSAIGRRVDAGSLHVVYAGVYAVGHPHLTRYGRWTAAVLACGPRAALAYATGAFLWSMRRAEPALIEVVVAHGRPRAHVGVPSTAIGA